MHFLADPALARELVHTCAPCEADTVVELGAGTGAVTAPLAATGARVLAVERDPAFLARLRTRFRDNDRVTVDDVDIRDLTLPRTRFHIVASLPYGLSTTACRMLFGPEPTGLRCASLLVEWGFAKRLTAAVPRSSELAWWNARFTIELRRPVAPTAFRPPPAVRSAHLVARRDPAVRGSTARALRTLLALAYRMPGESVRTVTRAAMGRTPPPRVVRAVGIDPAAAAACTTPAAWARLATQLADHPRVHWPPLPRALARHGVWHGVSGRHARA
ncbi:methyltransferase domain-containing protein [Haloechinothrix sp. LS1_15]|nr:methyltransferase domain-containing protein [Haloechinothrix sp. LS1_15]